MTGFDPHESIGFHCSITYRSFTRALEKRLDTTGVSAAQFIALAHLMAFGVMSQAELATHLSVSPVSALKLIDRMERDGWLKRHPSSEDRRVNQLVPTSKAEEKWDDLTVHARSLLKQAYRGIAKKEMDQAKRTLRRIRENLEA